jgi:hypothetical protein
MNIFDSYKFIYYNVLTDFYRDIKPILALHRCFL